MKENRLILPKCLIALGNYVMTTHVRIRTNTGLTHPDSAVEGHMDAVDVHALFNGQVLLRNSFRPQDAVAVITQSINRFAGLLIVHLWWQPFLGSLSFSKHVYRLQSLD